MDRNNKDVTYYLQKAFVQERTKKTPDIGQLAEDMGYNPWYLYKILEGERSLRFEDFPRLYRFTGGALTGLLSWLVRKCDPLLAVVSIDGIGCLDGSVENEKDNISIRLGEFVRENRRALADGRYDEDEVAELDTILEDIIKQAETARAEIRAAGERK